MDTTSHPTCISVIQFNAHKHSDQPHTHLLLPVLFTGVASQSSRHSNMPSSSALNFSLLLLLLASSTTAFLVPSPATTHQRRMPSLHATAVEVGEVLPTLEPTLKVTRYGREYTVWKRGEGEGGEAEEEGGWKSAICLLPTAVCGAELDLSNKPRLSFLQSHYRSKRWLPPPVT